MCYALPEMNVSDVPVIILAGGLGTRLRSVLQELPKPMAPVNGKPFLHYVFRYLQAQKIRRAVLSVGYRHEEIQRYIGSSYLGIEVTYSIEAEPLGTGGGVKQALSLVEKEAFLVNGDTLFDVPLADLLRFYQLHQADLVLSLKNMSHFDRYGTVVCDAHRRVTRFEEKKFVAQGRINGGVYLLNKQALLPLMPETKFSFETAVMEKNVGCGRFYGLEFDRYFIDIGIPEDYRKAGADFGKVIFQ